MKTQMISALFVCLAASVFAQAPKEQITVPLSDPSKPGSLDVRLITGSISVSGYAGNQIVIEAAGRDDDREPRKDDQASGMKRIKPGNGLDLTATEENNKVRISSKMMNKAMNLHIKVPQKFNLKVGTVNDGDISIENVDGELEISNVNGAIKLTNISGSAVANTINGNMKATFKSYDGKTPMAFSTLNGTVDVTMPPTAKFNVKIKSDQGEIYSDFDVDVDKTQPAANKTSKEGMYKVSIEDWVKGKVNSGGAEVMMKNMHGNIYLRKAK